MTIAASRPAETNAASATLLAPSSYYDPVVYERERAAIFAREWCFVAGSAQLAGSGDYVATVVAGYPLLVVNDGGALRAYYNVCRHRGGPLLWDGAGSCAVLVCRYHGWSYGLDGELRVARDFGADSLDAGSLSLNGVRVEVWRGLVFVNLNAEATPLIEWLGGIVGECAAYAMESFAPAHNSSHEIAANWKVYAENYQEGYHIPLVHPGLNRQIDARQYQVDVRDGYCLHRAPTRDGSVTSGTWLWRFPGLALNLYPNGMCVETYAPTGPASTRVDYSFFFSQDTPAAESAASVASSIAILNEDRVICEGVQRNMASGAYSSGLLSPRHECGVLYAQELVVQALAEGTA